MEMRLETIAEKRLIGKRMVMSFANNKTTELWQGFMPRRHEIQGSVGGDLYSLQCYPPLFFTNFSPQAEFEKWATVEVTDFASVPPAMETMTLPAGLYAVFHYQGLGGSAAAATFRYILGTWLPSSDYTLDARPHFEILGAKYKRDDPNSEEDIWIPIRPL